VAEIVKKTDHKISKPYQAENKLILQEPAGRKTIILKVGDHICANLSCKKVFHSEKIDTKYCPDCSWMDKKAKKVHEMEEA
jgi:hypothetical protein